MQGRRFAEANIPPRMVGTIHKLFVPWLIQYYRIYIPSGSKYYKAPGPPVKSIPRQILQVCQLIRAESLPILFGRNRFHLGGIYSTPNWLHHYQTLKIYLTRPGNWYYLHFNRIRFLQLRLGFCMDKEHIAYLLRLIKQRTQPLELLEIYVWERLTGRLTYLIQKVKECPMVKTMTLEIDEWHR